MGFGYVTHSPRSCSQTLMLSLPRGWNDHFSPFLAAFFFFFTRLLLLSLSFIHGFMFSIRCIPAKQTMRSAQTRIHSVMFTQHQNTLLRSTTMTLMVHLVQSGNYNASHAAKGCHDNRSPTAA